MKKFKYLFITLAVVVAAVLLTSCGEGKESKSKAVSTNIADEYYGADGTEIEHGEKIIKKAELFAETKSYDDATTNLKDLIKGNGGYISSSNSTMKASYNNSGETLRNANYTIMIPSDNIDVFIDAVGELLNITRINTSTEDVTDEYYDLQAIIETYQAKHDGLKNMLAEIDKNMDFSTWKQIENELTEVDVMLARYQAQLKTLENTTDYSTIKMTIAEVGEYTAVKEKTYWQEVKEAFVESIIFVGEFFKGLLIILIYIVPIASIIGGIVFVIILSTRKSRRRAAERRAAATAAYRTQQNNQQQQYMPPQYQPPTQDPNNYNNNNQ